MGLFTRFDLRLFRNHGALHVHIFACLEFSTFLVRDERLIPLFNFPGKSWRLPRVSTACYDAHRIGNIPHDLVSRRIQLVPISVLAVS